MSAENVAELKCSCGKVISIRTPTTLDNPLNASICKANRLTAITLFSTHVLEHETETKGRCPICGQLRPNLAEHIKTHVDDWGTTNF